MCIKKKKINSECFVSLIRIIQLNDLINEIKANIAYNHIQLSADGFFSNLINKKNSFKYNVRSIEKKSI